MRLEQLVTTPGLVGQSPSAEGIRERARLVTPKPIKLFYGETYDEVGAPIDSMKYYLFVSHLSNSLRAEGYATDPHILIADTAACRNVGPKNEEHYMKLGEERSKFVEQVNSIYDAGLRVVRMSDYIDAPQFLKEREEVIQVSEANPALMHAVEKTVPESKVEVERGKGFLYSFDEITTIMDLDIKVGPPREDLYDNVARSIAQGRGQKELQSLFLTPTFPVGVKWSYFFANEGIEDHGITAYKAGSKRLQRHRIVIGKSDPEYVKTLIADSFISNDPTLPNPTLDIGIISEMARKRLERDETPITLATDFYSGRISPDQLKQKVGQDVDTYVLSRFR